MSKEKLPKQYLQIRKRYEDFFDAVENLGKVVKLDGPLVERTALLIQLAGAVTVHSEGSVHSHVRRALDAGASSEEIHHAIILLSTVIGFPTVVAALRWADDIIKK